MAFFILFLPALAVTLFLLFLQHHKIKSENEQQDIKKENEWRDEMENRRKEIEEIRLDGEIRLERHKKRMEELEKMKKQRMLYYLMVKAHY